MNAEQAINLLRKELQDNVSRQLFSDEELFDNAYEAFRKASFNADLLGDRHSEHMRFDTQAGVHVYNMPPLAYRILHISIGGRRLSEIDPEVFESSHQNGIPNGTPTAWYINYDGKIYFNKTPTEVLTVQCEGWRYPVKPADYTEQYEFPDELARDALYWALKLSVEKLDSETNRPDLEDRYASKFFAVFNQKSAVQSKQFRQSRSNHVQFNRF